MTMKTYYMILLVSFFSLCKTYAQESPSFEFEEKSDMLDVSEVDPVDIRKHILGDEIAKKMVLFSDVYTTVEPASPTSPVEKTVIRKPNIYNSVKKLSKYYSKLVKKSQIDSVDAFEKFSHCIDVAISIAYQNTTMFESELKKTKGPEDIYKLFASVVLE